MQIIEKFLFEASDSDSKENQKASKGIIKYNDKILILRKAVNTPGEGSWDLPGGRIEDGENPKDALIREVKEETTLDIKNIKSAKVTTIKDDRFGPYKVNIYSADAVNDNVYLSPSQSNRQKFAYWNKPQPEHSEFKWIKYVDEIEDLNMVDEYKEELKKVLKEREV